MTTGSGLRSISSAVLEISAIHWQTADRVQISTSVVSCEINS
jgi:hypothetical protein